MKEALTGVEFVEMGTPKPLHAIVGRMNEIVGGRKSRVLVMVGTSKG